MELETENGSGPAEVMTSRRSNMRLVLILLLGSISCLTIVTVIVIRNFRLQVPVNSLLGVTQFNSELQSFSLPVFNGRAGSVLPVDFGFALEFREVPSAGPRITCRYRIVIKEGGVTIARVEGDMSRDCNWFYPWQCAVVDLSLDAGKLARLENVEEYSVDFEWIELPSTGERAYLWLYYGIEMRTQDMD